MEGWINGWSDYPTCTKHCPGDPHSVELNPTILLSLHHGNCAKEDEILKTMRECRVQSPTLGLTKCLSLLSTRIWRSDLVSLQVGRKGFVITELSVENQDIHGKGISISLWKASFLLVASASATYYSWLTGPIPSK
jgi:hypothetical protein